MRFLDRNNSDFPRWWRLRGQIKEREEPKKFRERIKMLELGKERVSSVVRLGRDCRREPRR